MNHGLSHISEYNSWLCMKQRCLNPSNPNFKDYGVRGIKIFRPWRSSFYRFITDMGFKPFSFYSLHRIDNNGNYSPRNCKWVSPKEQTLNRRPKKISIRNTSGFPGLDFDIRKNKWRIRFWENGKRINHGSYYDKEHAIKIWMQKKVIG